MEGPSTGNIKQETSKPEEFVFQELNKLSSEYNMSSLYISNEFKDLSTERLEELVTKLTELYRNVQQMRNSGKGDLDKLIVLMQGKLTPALLGLNSRKK